MGLRAVIWLAGPPFLGEGLYDSASQAWPDFPLWGQGKTGSDFRPKSEILGLAPVIFLGQNLRFLGILGFRGQNLRFWATLGHQKSQVLTAQNLTILPSKSSILAGFGAIFWGSGGLNRAPGG